MKMSFTFPFHFVSVRHGVREGFGGVDQLNSLLFNGVSVGRLEIDMVLKSNTHFDYKLTFCLRFLIHLKKRGIL
ncbi:hypothetical protein CAEBREN_08974 [Caenorhabditis brenneri]|uniref:Uncharacterized protein n=1 Tax=Caenorhabditis brenneri TaxID=135651 RepID=G0N029_CAEBE|nr:hypothetical protein CAEBREN_08974 [Caenorhabditis brenneri]